MERVFKKIIQLFVVIFALVAATRFVIAVLEHINPVSKDKYIEVYRDKSID